jgi:hypothetical protein
VQGAGYLLTTARSNQKKRIIGYSHYWLKAKKLRDYW